MLVVVLGLFALPFLTVGCVPTQYGSQSAGGSTDYTGYQLASGSTPRGTENLLPPADWLPDRVGLQGSCSRPGAVALVASFVVTDRARRLAVAVTAGLAACSSSGVGGPSALVALVTGQLGDQVLEEGGRPPTTSGPGRATSCPSRPPCSPRSRASCSRWPPGAAAPVRLSTAPDPVADPADVSETGTQTDTGTRYVRALAAKDTGALVGLFADEVSSAA